MTPENFPLLLAAVRRLNGFEHALDVIANGVADGQVRNVELNEAKFVLSGIVSEGWKKHVEEPYFYGGKWEEQPKAVVELNGSILIMGLHDMHATSRKLEKTKAQGPAVDAMRAFVSEVLPLAQAVASLKDKIVKGRAPNANPSKPVNPNKLVKTCPCCFRQIAVQGGTMAHHGYERPGMGWQTASCPGIRFRPLEVSTDGLVWVINAIKAQLLKAKTAYAKRSKLVALTITKRRVVVEVKKGSPDWDRELRHYVMKLEAEIAGCDRDLESLEKMLADWKPEVVVHVSDAAPVEA